MHRFIEELKDFPKKGDWVLLIMATVIAGFGCVVIASATNAPKFDGNLRYILIQIVAILLGICMYALVSSIDLETLSEHRMAMVAFNTLLLLMLIPFGTDNNTGNRSWLDFPLLPINIQPAEICKITYIIIMASVMSSHQNRISGIPSVMHMVIHLGLLVGLNMALSRDAGVSLIFVFIFIGMAFAGGVKLWWFLGGFAGIVAVMPYVWTNLMKAYQKNRILVIFDSTIDPQGLNERWHMKHSLLSLTGGGLSGQGLFHGARTQVGALNAQHTDFVFSAIGEELGLLGCLFTLLLLAAVTFRVIYVAVKTPDYMSRLVCVGIAAALIFQVCVNVGMCLGLVPVIGLTLPFISYGGSSIVSMYLAMGVVSSIHAHPHGVSQSRYIRPR